MRFCREFFTAVLISQFFVTSVANAADAATIEPPSDIGISGAQVLARSTTPESPSVGVSASGVFPGTNIRHRSCIGSRPSGISWDVRDDWFDNEYESAMQIIRADRPQAFGDDVAACVMRKITWRQMYVDDRIAPESQSQARDPSWSNYAWNQNDTIAQNLNSQYIQSGEAMLGLLIADQATAQGNAPPRWYIDAGFTFGNEAAGLIHNRMDQPEALAHVIDFYIALMRRYGGDRRLYGIVLGEYFAGSQNFWPSDFNNAEYRRGRREIWRAVSAAAPLDSDGNRIALYQTQPVLSSGVTLQDLLDNQMGVSESDVNLFKDGCGESLEHFECEEGTHAWALQQMEGLLPTMMNGDSRFARDGREWTWSGLANPFGFGRGVRTVASPQQLFWYHGSEGVIPLNSIFLKIEKDVEPQTLDNMMDAVRQFSRGGSRTSNWGTAPVIAQ